MAYQINLTGQEIDERLQNVGTPADNPDANGTLFARLNKNADDVDELRDTVGHIDSAQNATDKTVAQHTADINTLQTALKTKANLVLGKVSVNELPVATSLGNPNNGTIPSTFAVSKAISDKIVGLLNWQGVKDTTDEIKDIALAKKGDVWHSNEDGSEWVCTEDIFTADHSVWEELGTPIDLSGYYTKNEVDKKVKPLADSIGTKSDAASVNGSVYARIKKNQVDIADIGSRQTNIEEVVSGARREAYFSLRFLNLIVNSKFIADIDNIKVVLYRWSGKRYSELELFTKNGFGESQKIIQYVIILKQTDVNGVNIRTPYIHYNDDATEETLEKALKNAFGGRISYRKNKKKRWRLQAFLNGKPITAPFDFRVSIDYNDNYSLTKGGMMRSVPSSDSVVYDGLFNGSQWLRCKKGDLLDLSYSADAGILFPPTPGNVIGGDNNAKGCVVAVKNITQDASSVTVLWTVGDSLYEIGVEERTESDEYVHRCTSPAKKLCDDIYDYASKMNSGTLRDLYISAGAKYNETTGYYELNGLTDITEEQMTVIYEKTWGWWIGLPILTGFGDSSARTNIPCPDYKRPYYQSNCGLGSTFGVTGNLDNLEVLNFIPLRYSNESFIRLSIRTMNWMCQGCTKPLTIMGTFDVGNVPDNNSLNIGGNIKTINIKNLSKNIRFYGSKVLSKESVLYMINNSEATTAITIGLQQAVYDVMKDDADIIAALAEKTNITLIQNT
jgi:hypothetical protein